MCDPTGLAAGGLLIGGAQAITGYGAQKAQYDTASANASITNFERILNAIQNNVALAQTYNQIGNEQQNSKVAASTELFQDRIKQADAQGKALVSAGVGGVDGSHSANDVMQNLDAEAGRQVDAIDYNYKATADSDFAQADAAYRGTIARNRALPFAQQPVAPSPVSAALGVGAAAMSAGGTYYKGLNTVGTGSQTPLQQTSDSID